MAKVNLYQIFSIEREEKASVLLLSFQSIFVGIFYGSFDISAHALFLEVYPATMIPNAYVVSGLVGIIITYLYSKFQATLKFKNLALINLLFIAIITTILWYGFHFTSSNYWIFAVFVMMGPLNIIALLGFWGTAGRLFTLRQGKRLFGLIDSGWILGIIISTYAIPFLLSLGMDTRNLLLIAALSIGLALIIQWVISFKYQLDKARTVQTGEERETSELSLKKLFTQPYERLMAIFVILSMVTAFFIQYSFLSVTKDNYPDHTDLAAFLGYFTGSMTLFTFLFKTFVYSKLMKTYGLKISLLISPLLLGILTVIAVLVGSFYGYTSASASFAFFFLLISLSRLFSKALKDSVEAPSFKILYQSLPEKFRHDVQAKVDGTINEMAALSSGLVLAGFGLMTFIKLIHFSYFLLVIIGIWVFVAFWLYNRYRGSLEQSLSKSVGQEDVGLQSFDLNRFIESSVKEKNSGYIQKILGFYSDIQPIRHEHLVKELLGSENEGLRKYSMQAIENSEIYNAIDSLKKQLEAEQSEQLKQLAQNTIEKIDIFKHGEKDKNAIKELSKSPDPNNRIKALQLISENQDSESFSIVKQLLRDQNRKVKIEAIKTIPKLENPELAGLLIDLLGTTGVYRYAFDALTKCGDMVLDELEQSFYKSEKTQKDQMRIIGIFETIGTKNAVKYLENKLDQHNIDIFKKVLWALKNNNYQVGTDNAYQVQQLIEKHIGITGWNFAVKASLLDDNFSKELLDAIEEELEENYEVIYLLMIIAYNPDSVSHFKDNLGSGTTEGISFALELLELFLAEELKPKLFPLFDDISLNERVRQLQMYYPVKKMERTELLISILNRDMNAINVWTKACALYSYHYLENPEITDDIIAQLFNPIPVLSETASWIIYKQEPEVFKQCSDRLDLEIKHSLSKTVQVANESPEHLLINKVFALKNLTLFNNIPGYYITKFIDNVSVLDKTQTEALFTKKEKLKDSLLFLQKGEIELVENNAPVYKFKGGESLEIGDYKIDNCTVNLNGDEFALIHIVKSSFYFQMFDYPKIIENYIKIFDNLSETQYLSQNEKKTL